MTKRFTSSLIYQLSPKEIPLESLISCPNLTEWMDKKIGQEFVNRHEILGAEDVSFLTIQSNASLVVQDLDKLRRNPKKFICINDGIDHYEDQEAQAVKKVLHDFYESLFPIASSFELKKGQVNNFSYLRSSKKKNKDSTNEGDNNSREQMNNSKNNRHQKIWLKEKDRLKEETERDEEESRLLLALVSTAIILAMVVLLLLFKVRQEGERSLCSLPV